MRVFLTVLAGVLYALGWLAGKVWAALTWSAAAVRLGFTDATRAAAPEPASVRVPAWPAPPARAA